MSQYGSPPPSDPSGDGGTRIPDDRRPTVGPGGAADSWDQPSGSGAPGGSAGEWQQPAASSEQGGQYGGQYGGGQYGAGQYGGAPQGSDPYGQGGQYGGAAGGWGGGGYDGGYGGPGGPTGHGGQPAKGFFGALFDFSFSTFVTPMIVKFVYVLAIVALGLFYVFLVISTFTQSALGGIAVLVLGPVVILIYLCFIRMTLELYLGITRMSQDINRRLPDQS